MLGEKGLIQVYTGDGKGKTTAALGLALRAAGRGAKIAVVQFTKGSPVYGEIVSLAMLPGVTHVRTGRAECIFKGDETPEDFAEARRGLAFAAEFMSSGEYDLVVLDEINVAVDFGLLTAEEVAAALEKKSEETEVVLTGRNAPRLFIDMAALVTEMRAIKHPYRSGTKARAGVEY